MQALQSQQVSLTTRHASTHARTHAISTTRLTNVSYTRHVSMQYSVHGDVQVLHNNANNYLLAAVLTTFTTFVRPNTRYKFSLRECMISTHCEIPLISRLL